MLAKIFGGSNDSEKIVQAIRATVSELKSHISAEFTHATLEECAALCAASWRDLLDFEDVPKERRARLDSALSNSRTAYHRLARVGRAAYGPYINASTILFITLQVEAKAIAAPTAWRAVIRAIDESLLQVQTWMNEIKNEHHSRRNSVSEIYSETVLESYSAPDELDNSIQREPPEGPRRTRVTYHCYNSFKGTYRDTDKKKVANSRSELIRLLDGAIISLNRNLIAPTEAILNSWRNLREKATELSQGVVDVVIPKAIVLDLR